MITWDVYFLVLILNAAYNGQKLIKPVTINMPATTARMVNTIPLTTPKYQRAMMANATMMRIVPSVLLIFLVMIFLIF